MLKISIQMHDSSDTSLVKKNLISKTTPISTFEMKNIYDYYKLVGLSLLIKKKYGLITMTCDHGDYNAYNLFSFLHEFHETCDIGMIGYSNYSGDQLI